MDINTIRGLSSILVFVAFAGVCWWAFSPKRKKRFEEAANLPFADEQDNKAETSEQDKPLHDQPREANQSEQGK